MHIDFETYSEADIKKVGAWIYSMHPSTEVICMAYAEQGKPTLWLPKDPVPNFVKNLSRLPETGTLEAWNSFFEYCIWHNVLKWPLIPLSCWHDTMAQAAALALPLKLSSCGEALGLPQDKQKDKRGSYLIQRLCKPNRGKRIHDTDLLSEIYEYCQQDVVSEREIKKLLRPLNSQERKLWILDQEINIRGASVDLKNVNHAQAIIGKINKTLNAEIQELTNGVLPDAAKRDQVIQYCKTQGVKLDAYDKNYITEALKRNSLPQDVKRILEIRQQTGKTSLAKYSKLQEITTQNNRVHGLLMFHAATTGRWAGRLFQPQNLPRPSFEDTEACISLFHHEDPTLIETFYGEPCEALSSCVRGMIIAEPGKRLMIADYSAIEARVLAWLAGQKDILEVFKGHGKIYEHTASKIYSTSIESITKTQRFIGKVATLALGYQGGSRAFLKMAEGYDLRKFDISLSESAAEEIKSDWRLANRNIVRFWYGIEEAAKAAVKELGSIYSYRGIKFKVQEGFLFCRLPSGRFLAYYKPKIQPGTFGNLQVSFMGMNSYTRKWERQSTYGGKLVENITQAVARDIMASAMLRLDTKEYRIILTVHDEIISEVNKGFGSIEEYKNIMCELPEWAEGLPIEAEGIECKRYQK